jgi:hypothetical protein
LAEASPQRIAFGQGNAFATSGTMPGDDLDRRTARLVDHRDVEIALLVGLHLGLIDRGESRSTQEPRDRLLGRSDLGSFALILDVGLARRNAGDRERQPPRRREGLGAVVGQARRDKLVGHELLQILRRPRLHPRGNFLGEEFEKKIWHFAQTSAVRFPLPPRSGGEGSGVGGTGAETASAITCITPSIFCITSLFQNRSTRYPLFRM